MFPKRSKKLATQFCSCNFWDFLHVLMCIFLIHECRPTYHVCKTLTTGYNATVLYVKLLVPFLRISSHVERPAAFLVCIRSFISLIDTQNLVLPNKWWSWFIFQQDLPHLLVCYSQVVIRFHLFSICTVEVADTSQHLPHLNFLSKVSFFCVVSFNIFTGLPSQQDQYMKANSISYLYLTICQYMYHVATIRGQNE